MTGWIIFGGILAGIAALCLTNIRLDAFYRNGEMGAKARWLFVRYRIWPRLEKKEKAGKKPQNSPSPAAKTTAAPETAAQQKSAAQETAAPVEKGARRKKDLAAQPPLEQKVEQTESKKLKDTVGFILDLLYAGAGPAKMLYRHLWLRKLDLQLIVAREDAAETAIAYGQMNGWVHGAFAALTQLIHVKGGRVQVQADYLSCGDRLLVSGQLTLRVGIVLAAGIWFGIQFLKRLCKDLFVKNPVKTDERKEKRA